MATRLKKLQINEVSLCSAGANPGAFIRIIKRDLPTDEIELPEQYDDPRFDASGRGPMHERLWTLYDDNRRSMTYAQPAFHAAWDALTPDEKQTIRDEETAHAAAVQAQADAKQKESESEMNKLSDTAILIKGAHAIASGAIENDIRASRWHSELRKYATDRQEPGEKTVEQTVARLVKTDPDARALFRASLGGVADEAPATAPAPVVKSNPANEQIRALADQMQKADPNLTRLNALVKVHNSRPDLAAAAKAA